MELMNQLSRLQTILQSYSHQDSMVMAQKEKLRPMEKDRGPEIKPSTYGHLTFDKGDKDNLFNKYCYETWTATGIKHE